MLVVIGAAGHRGAVFVVSLLDRRKLKMDGALTLRGQLDADRGLGETGLTESGFSAVIGSEGLCISTESSHVTRLTFFPSDLDFESPSGLSKNIVRSLGLDDFKQLGLLLTGVAGGVGKEEGVVVVGEVEKTGVAGGVRRERLGTVVIVGRLPVEEELTDAVGTGL